MHEYAPAAATRHTDVPVRRLIYTQDGACCRDGCGEHPIDYDVRTNRVGDGVAIDDCF